MIRLNAFFEIKDGITAEQVKVLTDELVEKSRKEEGNKGYDLFVSTTNPRVYLFCESWENETVLEKHKQTAHYFPIIATLKRRVEFGSFYQIRFLCIHII